MRNFDFKRYTPRPKKLLRASLIKPFRLSGHAQVRFQLRAHTACWPLVKSYSNTLSWISKLKGHGK